MRKLFVFAVGIGVGVAGVTAAPGALHAVLPIPVSHAVPAPAPALPPVQVVVAHRLPFQDGVDLRGVVTPVAAVAIATQADGRIVAMPFREGSPVHRGDVLVKLDPAMAEARVRVAQADVRKAESAIAKAARDHERNVLLMQEGFLSRSTQETDEAARAALQAELDRSRAALDVARVELGRMLITSPIDGRAGQRRVDVGSVVRASDGQALTEVQRMDEMAVVVPFPVARVSELLATQGGAAARVQRLEDHRDLGAARLVAVGNAADRSAATVDAKLALPNGQAGLWPGQNVLVHVPLGAPSQRVFIPRQALLRSTGGDAVYAVDAASVVHLRHVTADDGDGPSVGVQGLEDGERVVVDGQDGLSPGARVAVSARGPA